MYWTLVPPKNVSHWISCVCAPCSRQRVSHSASISSCISVRRAFRRRLDLRFGSFDIEAAPSLSQRPSTRGHIITRRVGPNGGDVEDEVRASSTTRLDQNKSKKLTPYFAHFLKENSRMWAHSREGNIKGYWQPLRTHFDNAKSQNSPNFVPS